MPASPETRAGIRRELLRLAWPSALAMLVHSLFRINDQLFVRDLGVEAQAAVSVGSMVAIFLIAFGEMVGVGTMAIAARRFGEGRTAAGNATVRRGLRLGMLVGLGLAVATLSLLPWLSELLIPGAENALERQLFADYLTWIVGGQVAMASVSVMDHAFLALKDTRTSMLLQVLAVGTNAFLNWQLVPQYGVAGIGAATVASRALALAVGVAVLHLRGVGHPFQNAAEGGPALRILRIGMPACIAISIYSLVYQVLLATTFKSFPAAARSALGVGFGIETLFYSLFWGVGTAASGLVGRYLGEGDHDKTILTVRYAFRANLVLGGLASVLFLTCGEQLVRLLSADPDVIAVNTVYLQYMAIAQPFQAAQIGFDSALMGAGNTLPLMISTGVSNVLRIPLAHLLAIVWGFGLPGIWWTINLSSISKCIWSGILCARRRWLHTEV